jgi:hypothetical protein
MSEGSETDPQARIAELQRRATRSTPRWRACSSGDLPLLDDTATQGSLPAVHAGRARAARRLSRGRAQFPPARPARARAHRLWEGSKGALLEEIMGERDAIADSDQGRSFRAFWDFLMSSRRQEELTTCSNGAGAAARWLELNGPTQHPPRALRLAGSRRAHAAHGGPALAAVAPLSRRPGLAGEPPHHGHPARHREPRRWRCATRRRRVR